MTDSRAAEPKIQDLKEDESELSSEKQNGADPVLDSSLEKPASPQADDEVVYPTGARVVLILTALCMSVFLVALDQTIISTAIPKITDEFSSIGDIGWYGSAYLLTTTALQPTFGRIYTIFSVSLPTTSIQWSKLLSNLYLANQRAQIKATFITAICIFEVGSLLCGVAPTSVALIVGRAVAGLGTGGIFSGAIVIMAYCCKSPAISSLIFFLLHLKALP